MNPDLAQEYVFDLADYYLRKVETHVIVPRNAMEDAWPPSGEQDQRPAGSLSVSRGELSSLALAFGGHRPDPGQTTAERAQRAFNAHWDEGREFRVYFRPHEGTYEVHRIK